MCTVTLSYNKKDALARQALVALLSTGLFTQIDTQDDEELDDVQDEQAFNEILLRARQRIKQKEFYSAEEAIDEIFRGVTDVYEMKNAV